MFLQEESNQEQACSFECLCRLLLVVIAGLVDMTTVNVTTAKISINLQPVMVHCASVGLRMDRLVQRALRNSSVEECSVRSAYSLIWALHYHFSS